MKRPLYPFLFACYLVIAFAAENRAMIIRPLELGRTLALGLAVALAGWLLARLVTPQQDRRALCALLFVIAFSAFQRFRIELSVWTPPVLHGALFGFAVWSALLIAGVLLIARVRPNRSLQGLTVYFNLTAVILLAFPLLSLATARQAVARPSPDAPPETVLSLPLPAVDRLPGSAPDIYLIIVDQYTGTRLLQENYAFDNTGFERALDSLGFVVPARPRTNYVQTVLVLASMLNWTLLDGMTEVLGRNSRDEEPLHELIESNRTVHFLRGLGYRFVFVPTSYPATTANRWADVSLEPPARAGARLVDGWMEATPLGALLDWQCRRTRCLETGFPYEIESAERNEWKLAELGRLAGSVEGPKFVLAHLLMPHAPYLFRADCSHREPFWPRGEDLRDRAVVSEAYTAQITCLNRMLLETVRSILERSDRPPVILIQSDHGFGRVVRDGVGRSVVPFQELDPAQVRERLSVFAAYHLPTTTPAVGSAQLPHDSISPVNVLPLVFNRYLGTTIPLVPDDSWWSDQPELYDFVPVEMSDAPFGPARSEAGATSR